VATSRLLKIHVNKGKTIAQTITDRTDYAENPLKTRHGKLVTGVYFMKMVHSSAKNGPLHRQ
jgi:hypothetical protein